MCVDSLWKIENRKQMVADEEALATLPTNNSTVSIMPTVEEKRGHPISRERSNQAPFGGGSEQKSDDGGDGDGKRLSSTSKVFSKVSRAQQRPGVSHMVGEGLVSTQSAATIPFVLSSECVIVLLFEKLRLDTSAAAVAAMVPLAQNLRQGETRTRYLLYVTRRVSSDHEV